MHSSLSVPASPFAPRGKKQRAKPRQWESIEQRALIKWCRMHRGKWPELELIYAIPNGGARNKITAAILKAEGVRRDIPDLCLPVPRGAFHGLYIELKAQRRDGDRGRASKGQKATIEQLREQGYRAEVCLGWEAARDVIEEYLG